MRYTYLIPLLLCTPCSAAFINPIGGSWTDGTTVAEYEELPQTHPNRRQWRTFLPASNGTNVLAEASMLIHGGITWDVTVDAYNGMADISGEFEFQSPRPVGFALFHEIGMDVFIDGIQALDRNVQVPAGMHTISWRLDEPSIGLKHRSVVGVVTDIPEPSAAWLLAIGIGCGLCGPVRSTFFAAACSRRTA